MKNIRGSAILLVTLGGLALAVGVVCVARLHPLGDPGKTTTSVLTITASSAVAVSETAAQKKLVVLQTGQERMSNAVRCMAYVIALSDKIPKERAVKTHITRLAGVLFFNDCLMAKMSHGYITITTNELRQSFSRAVAQLFTNNVPSELVEELNHPSLDFDRNNFKQLYEHDQRTTQYPILALADGFFGSFNDHKNMRVSIDEQYRRMAQSPELARVLKMLDSAIQQGGITDPNQSDLKEMCLRLGAMRTDTYRMYGPQSVLSSPLEYKTMSQTLGKVLRWRLVNIYGLDDLTTETSIQALLQVQVNGFSRTSMEPAAVIQ